MELSTYRAVPGARDGTYLTDEQASGCSDTYPLLGDTSDKVYQALHKTNIPL